MVDVPRARRALRVLDAGRAGRAHQPARDRPRLTPKAEVLQGSAPGGEDPSRGADGHARAPGSTASSSNVPVYDGLELVNGNVVTGPAIIEQPTTTIVVPPGLRPASCDEYNNYLMYPRARTRERMASSCAGERPCAPHGAVGSHRIKVSVIGNRLDAISQGDRPDDAAHVALADLLRGARLRDRDLRPRTAAGRPDRVHPGADGRAAVRDARASPRTFAGDVDEGDVFILNDPYRGNNHPPDITIVKPVFMGGRGRLLGRLEGPSRRRRRRRRRRLQPGRAERSGRSASGSRRQSSTSRASRTRRCGTRSCSTSTCRSWSRATCNARSAR